jgi:aryl-alcohol dehydrogenase-like predicted oxidoreductase
MPRNTLGRTGFKVSLLGFGAEALGRKGRSFEDAEKTLHAVLDFGVNLIDTASAYGHSEEFIGRALHEQHTRGECVIVTKCGWTGDYEAAWSPSEIAATIDESLRRLRCDCVDALLLHSCDLETLKCGEVIDCVRKARDAGKAKFIGYSGDNDALKFAVECGVFDVVECSYSMLDQANRPMIELAAKSNIGVMLKRPMANAVPGAAAKPRSPYAAEYWPRWQEIGLTADDVEGTSMLEAALRFSAFQRGVTCVLIGSSNADHMRENARWLENGPLPGAVTTRVREAFATVGEKWPALG